MKNGHLYKLLDTKEEYIIRNNETWQEIERSKEWVKKHIEEIENATIDIDGNIRQNRTSRKQGRFLSLNKSGTNGRFKYGKTPIHKVILFGPSPSKDEDITDSISFLSGVDRIKLKKDDKLERVRYDKGKENKIKDNKNKGIPTIVVNSSSTNALYINKSFFEFDYTNPIKKERSADGAITYVFKSSKYDAYRIIKTNPKPPLKGW